MKPPKFGYVRATNLAGALDALSASQGMGKIIAGGQSLMPMLNFRLLSPSVLIDINRVEELDFLEEHEGGLRIGALTRHRTLETSPLVARLFPILAETMRHVAHLAIRNRGTIGGSITHADPAAELPLMLVLLDAEIRLASSTAARTLRAADFFLGALTSDVQEDEIVTEIVLPALPSGAGGAFEEVSRRVGDFALAAAGAILVVDKGVISQARLGVMGVADCATRVAQAEQLMLGKACDATLLDQVVTAVRASVEPDSDLHASGEYRRQLIGVLAHRAVATAWERAGGK